MQTLRTWPAAGAIALASLLLAAWLAAGPHPALWTDAVNVAAAAAASALFVRRAVTGPHPEVWVLLAAGGLLFTAAESYWFYQEALERMSVPAASPADAAYVAGYIFFAAALVVSFPSSRAPRDLLRHALDFFVLGTAIMAIAWILFIRDLAEASGSLLTETIVAAAYPVLDLALLSLLAIAAGETRPEHHPRIALFGMALASWLVIDSVYALQTIGSSFASGLPLDALWFTGYALLGAAALAQTPDPKVRWSSWNARHAVYLPFAILLPVAVIDYAANRTLDAALFSFGVVLVAAMAGRQLLFTRSILESHDQLARREAELRAAQTIAKMGSWTFHVQTRRLEWSPQAARIYGHANSEPTWELFMEMVHPDDRERVDREYWAAVGARRPIHIEHRIRSGSHIRHVVQEGLTEYDGSVPVRSIGTVRDVTERRRTDEALRFQAHLLDAVGQSVIATDLEGRITYWNPAAERLFGWRSEEVLGRPVTEVTPAATTREQAQQIFMALQRGDSWSGEIELRRRDGSTFLASVRDDPLRDEQGRMIGVIGVSHDVTAQRQAEKDLRERIKELRALSTIATAGGTARGLQHLLDHAVDALQAAFLHDDIQVEIRVGDLTAGSIAAVAGQALEIPIADGAQGTLRVAYRLPHEQQAIGPFLQEEQRLLEACAELIGSWRRRWETAEELQQREQALTEAQSIAHMGSWEVDLRTQTVQWSAGMYRVLHLDLDEPLAWDAIAAMAEPEERPSVEKEWAEALVTGRPFVSEHRFRTPDGTKWLQIRARIVMEDGQAVRASGTMQDITERRESERSTRFQARLLDAVGQAVLATDLTGHVTYWNPAAERMFGWTRAEALQKPLADLVGTMQTLERHVAPGDGAPASGDYRLQRHDGSEFMANMTTTTLTDAHGRLTGLIGVIQDVTVERQAEERVRASQEALVQAQRVARIGSWAWDAAFDRMEWSEQMYALYRRDPKRGPPTGTETLDLYVPESAVKVVEKGQQAVESKTGYDLEVQLDASPPAWLHVRAEAVLGADGGVAGLRGTSQDITAQKMAQERHARVQRRYQAIVEHAPYGIFRTTVPGDLQYANPASAQMLGYDSAQQLLEENPKVTSIYLRAEDRDRLLQEVALPEPGPVKVQFKRRDGSVIWVEISARMHREDGMRYIEGSIRDLTAERERTEVQAALAAIVEATDEAVYSMDIDGVVRTWNPAAEALYGYSARQAIGKPLAQLIVPANQVVEFEAMRHRLRAGHKIGRHDSVRRHKDGSLIDVSVSMVPIRDASGDVVGISAGSYDIGDRLRAEEAERARLENEHLKQLDQTLRDFINAAAHDLNQPLTPMRLALATLEDSLQDIPEVALRSLSTVKRSVDRMALLVADLLDVARLESGTLQFNFQDVDIADSLVEARDFFRPAAKEHGVTLDVEKPRGLVVVADPRRLMQVLFNLIGNAFKYTPPGGRVLVSARRVGRSVRVSVTDTGKGLTQEQMSKLFRPFSQVHTHLPDAPKGTGLGLYITKGIVEQHGGTVGVDSEGPGKGATFWFDVPLASKTPAAPPDNGTVEGTMATNKQMPGGEGA